MASYTIPGTNVTVNINDGQGGQTNLSSASKDLAIASENSSSFRDLINSVSSNYQAININFVYSRSTLNTQFSSERSSNNDWNINVSTNSSTTAFFENSSREVTFIDGVTHELNHAVAPGEMARDYSDSALASDESYVRDKTTIIQKEMESAGVADYNGVYDNNRTSEIDSTEIGIPYLSGGIVPFQSGTPSGPGASHRFDDETPYTDAKTYDQNGNVISEEQQYVDGSGNITINVSGSNASIELDPDQAGSKINISPNSQLNLFGYSDNISLQANSNSYAGIFGQNQTVTGDTGNDSVNLGGDDTSATVSGSGYVGLCGNNQSLTLTDAGASVGTLADMHNLSVVANNDTINLGNDASGNVFGSNDTVGFWGASGFAGIQGTGETIANNDASNLVNINGTGSSATVNGDVGIGLFGSNQSVTLASAGDHATVYGGFTGESINASGDSVVLGGNASANIFGATDTVNLQANSGAYVGVFGTNQTVTGDTGNDSVNLGGDGTSVTVDGGGYVGLINNGQTLTLGNSGSTVQTAWGVQNETINGSGEGVTLAASSQANVNGSNDTIAVRGSDTLGVGGGNDTIVAQGSGGSVYVTGTNNATDQINVSGESVTLAASCQANVNGSNDSIAVQGSDTLGVGGGNDTIVAQGSGGSVYVTGTNDNADVIKVSGETITLAANCQVIIDGSGNTIDGTAGQDNITIDGSDDHFSGNGDMVNFEGNIDSDTETGTNDSYFSNGDYIGGSNGSGWFDDPDDPDFGDDYDDGDPLVLNLAGGTVQTVSAANSPARFDLRNDGQAVQTGWGTAGEGYLVDTAKGNTTITDAADLVPSFAALQALDSNHDNKIDAGDASWSDLKVWVDGTGTAAFQSGSLRSLDDLGITAINLYPTPDRHLQNGNMILADGTFTWRDGSTGSIADVDFHAVPAISQPTKAETTGTAAQTQIATQAAQLVSAMSTFGTTSAADTATPGIDKPIHIPLAFDPTAASQRHAA